MTPQGRTELDAQAKPAWIGDYLPAYKLSPRLDRAQVQDMPTSALLFPDADLAAVRSTLGALGIEVFSQSDNGINKMLRFRATGPELASGPRSRASLVRAVRELPMDNANAHGCFRPRNAKRRVWDQGHPRPCQVVSTSDSGCERVTSIGEVRPDHGLLDYRPIEDQRLQARL